MFIYDLGGVNSSGCRIFVNNIRLNFTYNSMRKNYATFLNCLRSAALLLILTGTSLLTSARSGDAIRVTDGPYGKYSVDLVNEDAWFESFSSEFYPPELTEIEFPATVDFDLGWTVKDYPVLGINPYVLNSCTNLKKLSITSPFVMRGNLTTRLLAGCTSLERIVVSGHDFKISDGTIRDTFNQIAAFLPSRAASETPIVWYPESDGPGLTPYLFYNFQAETLVLRGMTKIDPNALTGWSTLKEIYFPFSFDFMFDESYWRFFMEALQNASISPKQVTIYIDPDGMPEEMIDEMLSDPNMPVSQFIPLFKECKIGAYSGISNPTVDTDENSPVEYFNLSGMKVNDDQLTPGLYIKRQGSKAKKVLVK